MTRADILRRYLEQLLAMWASARGGSDLEAQLDEEIERVREGLDIADDEAERLRHEARVAVPAAYIAGIDDALADADAYLERKAARPRDA